MANEITGTPCNCMDIGTVIQENDTTSVMTFPAAQTQQWQEQLTTLAREIESEPCTIALRTAQDEEQVHMSFEFCCAAEKLIFEMRCRSLS